MKNPLPSATDAERWSNIGRLFLLGHAAFAGRAEAKVRARGFPDFEGALPTLLRAMQSEGSRINDLAARAQMTPQGMGQIVSEMERRGYVVILQDPDDRRARIVRFSSKGRKLQQAAVEAIAEVEQEFKAVIGARKFAELKALMASLVDELPETVAYRKAFLTHDSGE